MWISSSGCHTSRISDCPCPWHAAPGRSCHGDWLSACGVLYPGREMRKSAWVGLEALAGSWRSLKLLFLCAETERIIWWKYMCFKLKNTHYFSTEYDTANGCNWPIPFQGDHELAHVGLWRKWWEWLRFVQNTDAGFPLWTLSDQHNQNWDWSHIGKFKDCPSPLLSRSHVDSLANCQGISLLMGHLAVTWSPNLGT